MSDEKVNILLVDDHPENLLALEALLSDLGQNLVRATSGTEALRLLLQQEFALILMDVEMPNANGFETAELIRQRDRSRLTPIIFLTAVNKTEQHVFKGYSVGAVDYLTKPFVPEILRSKVATFVELHKKGDEVKRQAKLLQKMVRDLEDNNEAITALNAALENERDFISTVLDTADSVVIVLDAGLQIISANRAFEGILGYSVDDFRGKPLSSFLVPASSIDPDCRNYESYWLTKDGGKRLFAWSQIPLQEKGRKTSHIIVTANDITERKEAEKQREEVIRAETSRAEAEAAEQRAALLAEASNMLASTLDYEQTLTNISRLAIPTFADWCFVFLAKDDRITGPLVAHKDAGKEELARNLVIRTEDLEARQLPVARVFLEGASELLTDITPEFLQDVVRDQEQMDILLQLGCCSAVIVPIVGRQRILGIIGFGSGQLGRYKVRDLHLAQDLAHRVSLALENARLYREAQDASRAKDEFLATLSHELRTPLNAILGWTQILRKKRLDEVTNARAFEAIERNAKSQAELIEDMLDVSRIITGRLRLEFQATQLSSAVEAALDSVRPAAEAKGVRLEYSVSEDSSRISGDPNRLQQIVWNLLSNAVKFTPAGGNVSVNLERLDSSVRLTVRDTGKGISPQFLPLIFDRFRQAETTISRSYGGLGLGLSIARHLVELHGGTIEGTSEGEGKGATFTVTFPVRETYPVAASNAM